MKGWIAGRHLESRRMKLRRSRSIARQNPPFSPAMRLLFKGIDLVIARVCGLDENEGDSKRKVLWRSFTLF